MELAQLFGVCHRCPHVDWKLGNGRPPCTKNGKYFVDNCEAGICPVNYFTHPPAEIPANYTTKDATKGDCGC